MQVYSIAIAVLLSCTAAMLPARAHACSCSPAPIYHSQPADGSKNVPRDIAPVIEGPFDPSTVTLEDEHGAKLTFTLDVGPRLGCLGGWAELRPRQPLAATTRYTVRVGALYPDALAADERVASISFTTGSDELADRSLERPRLTAASILRGAPDCGGVPTIAACIGGLEEQAPTDLELIARRGDKILLRITSLIQGDGSYGLEEQPDCIELRRRAADGRRSEPTTICGAALLARDYRESDSTPNGWVECKDGILGDRDAYDESLDAGAPREPVADASAADDATPRVSDPKPALDASTPDASTPDASTPRAAESTPSDSGCSVVAGAPSDLPRAVPFLLGYALLLGASRRRKRG